MYTRGRVGFKGGDSVTNVDVEHYERFCEMLRDKGIRMWRAFLRRNTEICLSLESAYRVLYECCGVYAVLVECLSFTCVWWMNV